MVDSAAPAVHAARMHPGEVRRLRAEVGDIASAALLKVLDACGLVSDAVVAEIVAADAAQAKACGFTPERLALLLTVEQAALRLAVGVEDVQWMYLRDGLHYIRFGPHSDEDDTSIVRIHPDDLDAYVARRRVRTS